MESNALQPNDWTNKKKGSPTKWIAPLTLFFFALLVGLCWIPLFPRLVIEDTRKETVLMTLPIARNESFDLVFKHSVNLSDVTDEIQWTGKELMCRSTLFTAFGAGIPVLADGIGTDFTQTEEGFLITGIDKPETVIYVMLQTVPNHRLIYRGTEIPLLKQYGSGTLLSIQVRPVSLVQVLFSEHIPLEK